MAIIGIDLGTTNSLATALVDGKPCLIPNEFGEYLTPSIVHLSDNGFLVGKMAKDYLVTEPEKTVQLFKRYMGTDYFYRLGKTKYNATDLSALVVKQLIADAERFLKETVDEVVISVPAYFNDKHRRATKDIGELLGVKVERLINEPSAAAIACHKPDTYETFIVFDFGGGTLDVSVVDCFENVISICSIAGGNYLGGSDFDEALLTYFCQHHQFPPEQLDRKTRSSLLLSAERCRLKLQTEETAQMSILLNDELVGLSISKSRFIQIVQPILERIKKVIARAVRESGFQATDFDSFILVGGASKMPVVQDFLMGMLNLPITFLEDSDELVAKGLGTYIGIKSRHQRLRDLVVTDVCPFSLGIKTYDSVLKRHEFTKIINKNTILPTSYDAFFSTIKLGQSKINLEVYQGESLDPELNLLLGKTTVVVPENHTSHEMIRVTFSYDLNAILYVEVTVLSTGEQSLYKVGKTQNLVSVETSERMEHIKELAMALSLEPEYETQLLRLKRLATELPSKYQETIYQTMLRFETDYKASYNNLQQKKSVIQQFTKIINQIEVYLDGADLDIFKDLGEDDV